MIEFNIYNKQSNSYRVMFILFWYLLYFFPHFLWFFWDFWWTSTFATYPLLYITQTIVNVPKEKVCNFHQQDKIFHKAIITKNAKGYWSTARSAGAQSKWDASTSCCAGAEPTARGIRKVKYLLIILTTISDLMKIFSRSRLSKWTSSKGCKLCCR